MAWFTFYYTCLDLVSANVADITEQTQMCFSGVGKVRVHSPHSRRSLWEVCPALQRPALEARQWQQRGAQPVSEWVMSLDSKAKAHFQNAFSNAFWSLYENELI